MWDLTDNNGVFCQDRKCSRLTISVRYCKGSAIAIIAQ